MDLKFAFNTSRNDKKETSRPVSNSGSSADDGEEEDEDEEDEEVAEEVEGAMGRSSILPSLTILT